MKNEEGRMKIGGDALAKLSELAGEVAAARQAAGDYVAEVTAGWVGPHYLLSLSTELGARSEGADRFKLLRQAAGDVVGLQRGGMWSARMQLERERLEFQRQKHRDKLAGMLPGANNGKRDPLEPMTEEELKACVDRIDEIMGIKKAKEEMGKATSVQHPSSREIPSTNISSVRESQ